MHHFAAFSTSAFRSLLNASKFACVCCAMLQPGLTIKDKRPPKSSFWSSVVPPAVFWLGVK